MASNQQNKVKHVFDIEVKAADMHEEDTEKMHSYIQVVFANFNSEEDIAQNLKLELDKNEGMGWNVVVGSDFGSHVFHRTKKYIYVRVLELYVLIWKS